MKLDQSVKELAKGQNVFKLKFQEQCDSTTKEGVCNDKENTFFRRQISQKENNEFSDQKLFSFKVMNKNKKKKKFVIKQTHKDKERQEIKKALKKKLQNNINKKYLEDQKNQISKFEKFRVIQRNQLQGKIKINLLKPQTVMLHKNKKSKIFNIFPESLQKIFFTNQKLAVVQNMDEDQDYDTDDTAVQICFKRNIYDIKTALKQYSNNQINNEQLLIK